MNKSEQKRRQRRLERAGYAPLPRGWVTARFAAKAAAEIEARAEEIEEIARTAPPRGRPPKVDAAE